MIFTLGFDVDVSLEVILRDARQDLHGGFPLLGQVDRLLHQAHDGLALFPELHRDKPKLGITHRRMQRLLIDVGVQLPRPRFVPRRRVPLLDHALQLLLVLHTFKLSLILHPRVQTRVHVSPQRLALLLIQRFILLTLVLVLVFVRVGDVGDVVDESRPTPLLLRRFLPPRALIVVIVFLRNVIHERILPFPFLL